MSLYVRIHEYKELIISRITKTKEESRILKDG
jgi:hypothetical protein